MRTPDSDSEGSRMVAVAGGLISMATDGNAKIATSMTCVKNATQHFFCFWRVPCRVKHFFAKVEFEKEEES